jgi:hypothetical protein
MPTPTHDELKYWAENYVALWNAGDKDAWIANWKKVAPGEFRMLDPVGTPEKRGFDHCCADSFDLFQPNVKFKIQPGTLNICANEVAWLLENHITADGKTTIHYSIETYRFGDDGSCNIRTYYRVPPRTNDELGQIFQTYLPE